MGQFSYDCKACGGHEQFCWVDECAVKIGDVHVKGEYDGYGRVEVFVVTNQEVFERFNTVSAAEGKSIHVGYRLRVLECLKARSISSTQKAVGGFVPPNDTGGQLIYVNLEQFRQFFQGWHGQLGCQYNAHVVRYNIVKGSLLASDIYCCGDREKIAEQQAKKDAGTFKEWDELEICNCVPDGIAVKDYLLAEELGDLPKVDFSTRHLRSLGDKVAKWRMIEGSDEWRLQKEFLEQFSAVEYPLDELWR